MNGSTLHTIGELARRSGVPVKTIRFYSDCGILTPAGRTSAGYRLYDDAALAGLELVRTLRTLGLDLATVRKVVDRDLSVAEVAAAHVEALDVQIRILHQRRALLTTAVERDATAEELTSMHRLAELGDDERRRLIDDFLDTVFASAGADPAFAGIRRTLTPELPANADPEQVEAWTDLVELSRDRDFRSHMREMAAAHATENIPGIVRRDLTATVRDRVTRAVESGIEPESPRADPIVAAFVDDCARFTDGRGDPRAYLLTRLEAVNDPRHERYSQLLAVVNGWSAPTSPRRELDWAVDALRHREHR